jgi:PAS domain S-box-containing protein
MVDPEFWSSRLHPDDRDMALNAFDGLADTNSLEIEYRWQKSDGEYIWIQDNAVLVTDEKGNPKEIIGTWIDVSDRKEAEYAVRESEDRYRTLFDNASDAIFIIRENHVIDCNKSIENMFGYSKEEVIGKHPGEVSPTLQPDGQESVSKAETLNRKLKEGSSQLFEWVHQRKDGSEFTAEVKLHQISIQDETLSLAVLRDVTERKNAEAAAQEERQRLARDLHDAVSQTLWSASLIADVLPDIWQQDPNKGLERLERLRQLTRGALAEMRALLLELRPKALVETKMVELLKRLVEATTSHSGAQISLAHEGECDLPEDVHVAFYRVAQEALNNATQHAMASEIKIRLDCGPKHARLTIEDNGGGFDPVEILQGQHLGLKIMGERATSIEANLDISSRSGEGTQVVLIWPDDGEVNDD